MYTGDHAPTPTNSRVLLWLPFAPSSEDTAPQIDRWPDLRKRQEGRGGKIDASRSASLVDTIKGRTSIAQVEEIVPKYVTIGYGDQAGYGRTASEVLAAAHGNDDDLKRRGALVGVAGPPVQVRNPDGAGVQTEYSAFMSAPLPIAGFAVFEAANLAEAIKLVSRSPCAVAHGVVEVWPLEEA